MSTTSYVSSTPIYIARAFFHGLAEVINRSLLLNSKYLLIETVGGHGAVIPVVVCFFVVIHVHPFEFLPEHQAEDRVGSQFEVQGTHAPVEGPQSVFLVNFRYAIHVSTVLVAGFSADG